jgi:hypothetical protein
MRSRPQALLDANVLYSGQQRNLILQLAVQEVVSVIWTEAIEEEWLRNLEPETQVRIRARTLPQIRQYFPDALIGNVDLKASVGRTNAKDVHVAAAAVKAAPCNLVTWNIRHFDAEELRHQNVSVVTPDVFLCAVFDADPELVFGVTKNAAANLTRSAPTWAAYLEILSANGLKDFADRLCRFDLSQTDDINLVAAATEASGQDKNDKTKGPGEE